jgi:hypothetical protein
LELPGFDAAEDLLHYQFRSGISFDRFVAHKTIEDDQQNGLSDILHSITAIYA